MAFRYATFLFVSFLRRFHTQSRNLCISFSGLFQNSFSQAKTSSSLQWTPACAQASWHLIPTILLTNGLRSRNSLAPNQCRNEHRQDLRRRCAGSFAFPTCSVFSQTASMEAEIDCNLPSNSS